MKSSRSGCRMSLQVHRLKDKKSSKFPNSLKQGSIIEPSLYIYIFLLAPVFEEYHAQALTNTFNSKGCHCSTLGLFPLHSHIATKWLDWWLGPGLSKENLNQTINVLFPHWRRWREWLMANLLGPQVPLDITPSLTPSQSHWGKKYKIILLWIVVV